MFTYQLTFWTVLWDRNYYPCVERRELKLGRLNNLPSILWFVVLFSCYSLRPHGLQYARLPCCSLSSRVFSNSCPLNRWCHTTILSSVTPFSSCPQSFPASGSFPESALHIRWPKCWTFSFSISPYTEYSGWIPSGLTGLSSLLSKGL